MCSLLAEGNAEQTEKKYEMANVDSTMRSVHTTSRTRIMWGIGIAIVGGKCSLLLASSHVAALDIMRKHALRGNIGGAVEQSRLRMFYLGRCALQALSSASF